MLRTLSLFAFLLFFSGLSAQGINGYWKGRLVMEPGGCFPVYNIEFQLQIAGTKISGSSYHYSDTSNYVKEEFEGVYDTTNKSMVIKEQKVSIFHIPPDCIPCIKEYSLTFHTDGKEEQLRGSWTGLRSWRFLAVSGLTGRTGVVARRRPVAVDRPAERISCSLSARRRRRS